MNSIIGVIYIVLTIFVYFLANKLYAKYKFPLLVPITTSTIAIILILLLFHISYNNYMHGGKWINMLLGPAVVSFAYPLYEHRKTLSKYFTSIFVSVLFGTIFGLVSGILLSEWLGINKSLILSLAAKSVTTPIAMSITSIIGGIPSLTVVYVMIAGISGAVFGPYLLSIMKIKHPVAIGIGYGTASHGVGTAKATEYGELEKAISSIAMTLSSILASIFYPFLVHIMIK
jgi:predicted murein hydrolase (TIGR00659 family)